MRYSFLRSLVWMGAAALFSSTLQAQSKAVSPLVAPEVIEVIRSAQKGRPDARIRAVEHQLLQTRSFADELIHDLSANAQQARKPEALSSTRSAAAAKRHEMKLLRDELLGRVDGEMAAAAGRGESRRNTELLAFRGQLAERFALLDEDLRAVATADANTVGNHASRLRERLAAWEASRPVPTLPAPNWKRVEPVPSMALAPTAMPPRFVSDAYWLMQRKLASRDGLVQVALRSTPAEAQACGYTASDLASSDEAPTAHPDIVALARQLDHNPVRMFEWVQQNIAFEPYYGSMKGAVGALWSRSGGATDQASLLVALLRASNIPARYVRGQISVLDNAPSGAEGRAPRWIGAKSYQAAASVLSSNGNPSVGTFANSSGQEIGITLSHVWVQTCLPYAAYRGTALDDSGHRWLPLDPSYKDRRYQPGIAVDPTFDFDYPAWLSRRLDAQGRYRLPQEALEDQVEAHAKTKAPNYANNALADVPYRSETRRQRFDVLPIVPPYEVQQYTSWSGVSGGSAEAASLPDRHKYRLRVLAGNAGGGLLAQKTLNLADLVSMRLTLSFKGETAADQSAYDSWFSALDPAASPACAATVNMVPVFKLQGVEQASEAGSGSVALCSGTNQLAMSVSLAELGASATRSIVNYTNIAAANLHALHAFAWHTSDTFLNQRSEQLLASVRANLANPNADRDGIEGEFLNIAASKYSRYVADANKRAGELFGESGTSGVSLGLTSAQVKVNYLFDLPYGLFRKGFLIDWPGGQYSGSGLDVVSSTDRRAFKLAGFASSAYEAYIWQELATLDAVSTTRGLQFAQEQGVEVLQINSASDWVTHKPKLTSNADSTLNYSAAQVSQIETAYVNQGFKLSLPRSLIRYPDASGWKGTVYYIEKFGASSASAGFIISGGSSGGVTVEPDATPAAPGADQANEAAGGYGQGTPLGSLYNPTLGTGIVGNGSAPGSFQSLGNNGYQTALGFGTGTSVSGDPVNMVTGNLIHSERDIAIKGRGGLPLVFERWYNSQGTKDGPLGFGWTHSFNHQLRFYGVEGAVAKLAWVDGTGGERFFSTASHTSGNISTGASFSGTTGVYATLERLANGQYRVTERSGMQYLFESVNAGTADAGLKARLLAITDRNGNALSLSYAATAGCTGIQVCRVSDALNRALSFTYSGTRISQIQDWSGRRWQYQYDANGDLVSFANPLAVAGGQNPVGYQYYGAADGSKLAHALKRYILPRGNGMHFEYYANGRVFRHTPFGVDGTLKTDHATSFGWSPFRREARQTDALGNDRVFLFDAHGNPISITDEAGARSAYTYDSTAGRTHLRLSKTDPMGMVTQYAYDSAGNLTDVTLPSLRTLSYRDHNGYGQPRRIKDADNQWSLHRMDAQGRLTDLIRLRAGVTPVADTRPATGDIVQWTQFASDGVGNPTVLRRLRDWSGAALGNIASGMGPSVETTYDASLLNIAILTRRGDTNGSPTSLEVQSYSDFQHDSLGRMTRGPDANWYAADSAFDSLDRPIKAPDGRGHQWDTVFDANGNPLLIGLTINGAYVDGHYALWDDLDRMERRVDYAGNATLSEYNPLGHMTRVTSPDGYAIGFDRDPLGRVTGAYNEEGHRVSLSLDADGRVRSSTDPNNLRTQYDFHHAAQDGRLNKTTLPQVSGQAQGRAVEVASYDGNGRPQRINMIAADGSVRDTYRFYDELGRLVREVGPQVSAVDNSRPVSCTVYTALGDVQDIWAGSTTDTTSKTCNLADVGLRKQQGATYDDWGRLLSQTDALGRTWRWTWNIHNELISSQSPVQAAAGQSSTYAYGSKGVAGETQGLLKQRSVPGSQTAIYTRNALGLITRAETRNGAGQTVVAYDYGYDPAKRLASVTDSRGNKTIAYTWSPGGRLARVQDSDGHVASFSYDATGRLAGITAPNGQNIALSYDAAGRLIEQRLASGLRSTHSWFEDGSLKQKQNLAGSSVLSSHVYSLDAQGRRSAQVENIAGVSKSWSYGYDNLDRLSSASDGTAETYGYDIWGNRRSKSKAGVTTAYLYDAAHQLSEIRSGSDSGALIGAAIHDADGHLIKLCEGPSTSKSASDCTATGSGASTLALVWNALDHLQTATRSGTGAVAESYQYDDSGRRIGKTSGGTATSYLYNGEDIHAEWNGSSLSGNPAAAYVHGAGMDSPVLRLTGATRTPAANEAVYLQDGLGSVVGLANTAGSLTASQRFDAWGNETSASGTVPQYGYTGREPDASGLVYYRARYYHPGIGRFTSRDPMGMVDAISPYAYVANSPTNFVDPSGQLLDIIADVGFILYDIGVIAHDVYKTGGQNLGVHATALALDVGGAVLPFVTGAGQAYRAGNKLVDVAKQAENAVPRAGLSPQQFGSKAHKEFDKLVESGAAGKNVVGERAYVKNDLRASEYRPPSSSNPDAVVGNPFKPHAAFDLKTGRTGITSDEMNRYGRNLPEGTPIYELKSTGHNAPRPQSMSGMGAGLNTGYLLGDLLFRGDSVPYLGGNAGGGTPRLPK